MRQAIGQDGAYERVDMSGHTVCAPREDSQWFRSELDWNPRISGWFERPGRKWQTILDTQLMDSNRQFLRLVPVAP